MGGLKQISFTVYEVWCLIFLLLLLNYSFSMCWLYGWPSEALYEFCKGTVFGGICCAAGMLLLCSALCAGTWVQNCGSEIKL